jgi:hypothetical protein
MVKDKNFIDPTTLQVGSCYAVLYDILGYNVTGFMLVEERKEHGISVDYIVEKINYHTYDIVKARHNSDYKNYSYIPISIDMYNNVKNLAIKKNKIDKEYRGMLLNILDTKTKKYCLKVD